MNGGRKYKNPLPPKKKYANPHILPEKYKKKLSFELPQRA